MRYVMMAVVFLLTACEKEHVCECRTPANNPVKEDNSRYIFKGSLSSAENSCVSLEKKKRSEDGHTSDVCEITNE